MERTIQIVEDDADIRFILDLILSDAGFTVESFSTINEFSQRSRKEGVQLIILDVRLPDGNGIDLCKHLKSSSGTAEVPVVIMSAHANGESAFLDGKADDFIAKPFDLDLVVARVKSLVIS
jgi:DNA-binding response OmpR family regulator